MKRKISTQMITVMALLIALTVVLSNILGIETQLLKVTFAFVPQMVMGMLFGPFWTAVGAVIADLIGNTMFAKAPFFIGFTLNKIIAGLIYGYFFYNKKVTWKNTILCAVTLTLLLSLCLTPIWLSMMYHIPLNQWQLWVPRLIKAAIMIPIEAGTMYVVGNMLPIDQLTKKLKLQ